MMKAKKLWRVGSLAVVVVGLGACGGGESSSPKAAPGASAKAEKPSVGPEVLTVGQSGSYVSFSVGPDGHKPSWKVGVDEVKRSSDKLLVAKVNYEEFADCVVTGISVCGVSARHFSIEVAGKRVLGSTFDLQDEPKLDSLTMQAGEATAGYVGFEVPSGSGEVLLAYDPYPGQVDPQFAFRVSAE